MEVRESRGRFIKGNVPRNKKGQCVHHWMIDKNNVGTCKKCGAVKDFGELLGNVPFTNFPSHWAYPVDTDEEGEGSRPRDALSQN